VLNNDQQILPKSSENAIKIAMKIWIDFGWILDAFWSPRLMVLGARVASKRH